MASPEQANEMALWLPYVLGGGLVSALASQVIAWLAQGSARKAARQDRDAERRAARTDAHRQEMKSAYADFIGAYSRFLDSGHVSVAAAELVGQNRLNNTPNPDLTKKSRELLDVFVEDNKAIAIKVACIVLLDDDATRTNAVTWFDKNSITLPNPEKSQDDYQRFRSDLKTHSDRLDELRSMLRGAFAPESWDETRALGPGKSAKQLPSRP